MRIGVFTNAYRPVISGVVNSIDLIRKELLRQGHTVYLFAPRVPGYRAQHSGIFYYPSLDLSRKIKFPLPIPCSCRVSAIVPKLGLDVIHTHHPFLLGDTAASFARKLGIPLVYTFHTQYEQYAHYIPFHEGTVRWLARTGVVRFTRKCDLLIAPSSSIVELLHEYRIQTRTETVPNAIDLSRFAHLPARAEARARLGLPAEATIAIYAGRLGLEKNLEYLVRSMPSSGMLLIVGEGPERARLQRLGGNVRFTGAVEYAEMPVYYAAADFFAMTSTTEVKPLVVLEAMAAGLAVVAIAACGTQDTITHETDGLLGTAEEFPRLLARAFDSPREREHWGAQARLTAQQYSIEAYTRRLVELYGSLIS